MAVVGFLFEWANDSDEDVVMLGSSKVVDQPRSPLAARRREVECACSKSFELQAL